MQPTAFQNHFDTPHMAQLAAWGIRFTDAYSCAVCSPTRTSILTGQNAARHRVTNWTLYADRDQSGTSDSLGPPQDWRRQGLQPDALTLPRLLKLSGYTTIHCGKAHWGAFGTRGADPTRLGFDINIAGHPAGAPGSYQGRDNYGNHADGSRKLPWGVPGLEKYYGTQTHLTDALAAEAAAAIDSALDRQRPFFLYMAPYAVHTPLQPHPRFIDQYQGQAYDNTDILVHEPEAQYASMVKGCDAALGQLLSKLKERGQAENTIIVVTSDNGGLSVHSRGTTPRGTGKDTHNWPLREGKGSAYEGGTRVPLIISWARPNPQNPLQQKLTIEAGSINSTPVICEDYLPTLCHWAGIHAPSIAAEQKWPLDGVNLTGVIQGQAKLPPRPLIFHYPHFWGPQGIGYQPHSAMRLGPLKLIHFYHNDQWELYDLSQDISESNNRFDPDSSEHQQLQQRMIQELEHRNYQLPEFH